MAVVASVYTNPENAISQRRAALHVAACAPCGANSSPENFGVFAPGLSRVDMRMSEIHHKAGTASRPARDPLKLMTVASGSILY